MVQLKKKLSGQMRVRSIPPFAGTGEMPEPDLYVVTSGGMKIPAHSKILASATPVLESIIERPQKFRSGDRKISIPGVPSDAVYVFVQFFYTSKITDEQMEKYGMHLLALSHVYSVQHLKQRCTRGLAKKLNIENVVDMLQLARLCDAPDLYLNCMKLVSKKFKAVEKTEAWVFMQEHDPLLELEILQFFDDVESRRKRTKRHKRDQNTYLEISEAMDCLEHICTEGCTLVGPSDMDTSQNKSPCSKFSTCQGIQMLIRHFGACEKKVNGGCSHCKRMWQLFRLHSSMCDQPDECRVPLCRHLKSKAQQDRRGHDARWKLLVKKVISARTVSSLSIPFRKREVEPRTTMNNHHHHQGTRNFTL